MIRVRSEKETDPATPESPAEMSPCPITMVASTPQRSPIHPPRGQRHDGGADVVRGEERSRLGHGEPEILANEGGDRRNAEGAHVGHGLGGHDQSEHAPAPRSADGCGHAERAATSAMTVLRSSSVSTPMVGSRVSSTRIGMPCSRKRSCSSCSACSSGDGGSEWNISSTERRYAYMPMCFQYTTSPRLSRSQGMGSREK